MARARKKKVVVIDDSEITREVVAAALRESGCEVICLETAIGSTSVIFREESDLVLIDVRLPTLSGEKLADIIRRNSRLDACRVVLFSGASREELGKMVKACGADGFVSKEDEPEEFLSQIRSLLDVPSVQKTGPSERGRGKVLVVDDSEVTLESVALSLEPAGFQVIKLTDPLQVLDVAKKEQPDLVLMDINMPIASGESMAELLKKMVHTPGTRVLLHSSLGIGDLESAAARCGADGYVQKTGDPEQLIRQVIKWLG